MFGSDDIKKLMGKVTTTDLMPYYPCDVKPESISEESLSQPSIDKVRTNSDFLNYLSNAGREMRADFLNYVHHMYPDGIESGSRNDYVDVGCLSRFIVLGFKTGCTQDFGAFFSRCESLLGLGDKNAHEFVVIGAFEGIQNIAGWHEVNYHVGFDKWLGRKSKVAWDELIRFCERTT